MLRISAVTGQNYSLRIYQNEVSDNMKRFEYAHSFKDSLNALREVHAYVLKLHEQAYLEAATDSVLFVKDSIKAYVHIGPRHNWSHLQSGNVPDEYLYKSGYKQKFFSNTRFSYRELSSLENRVIRYSENNGYPFASIALDSISMSDSYFSAVLHYEPGPLIRFDTVTIIGNTKVKRKYLESYLGIVPGSLYNHQKTLSLERQLRQIQYLQVTRSPEVFFALSKAQPVLFIDVRKCNQLDGYIGFQPNTGSNSKLLLTGEFNMDLKNLLQSGKELKVQWKRFDQQSQLLNSSYLHSRLFRSNVDVGLEFDLLKQDTSYLLIDRKVSLIYALTSASKLKLFTGLRTNSTLTSVPLQNNQGYNSDFRYVQYGVGYSFTSLDDVFYPMTGWLISFNGSAGNKKITNTPASLEGVVPASALQWNVDGLIEKYIRVGKRATLVNHVQGAYVQSQNLVLSDLYRLGGLKTLRGFNENNYFLSDFMMYSVEYRYFTDANSYVLLFFNQAYIHNRLNNNYSDWPLGFGTGISFSTKAGVFQFVYAVGNAKDQPLNFNLSKIHFGLVTRF